MWAQSLTVITKNSLIQVAVGFESRDMKAFKRVVNAVILVLQPIVLVILFCVSTPVLAILFLCSFEIGIGNTFSLIFSAVFNTNNFVVMCTS